MSTHAEAPPTGVRVAILGVGLIGGSFALAVRQAGVASEVIGCGRSAEHLEKAVTLGVIDRYTTDPAVAARDADFILLSVPLGAMRDQFEALLPGLAPGAVVSDAGSAKASVVDDAVAVLPPWALRRFVPGHPIAGHERSGVEAASATLYQHRRVILTPLEHTDAEAIDRASMLWTAAGASVSVMGIRHHDDVLAATSHLPHMLAYALVDTLSRWSDRDEIFQYAAGGFRDFTRIASSDPVMWRDICLHNREALVSALERFQSDLQQLTEAVRRGDGDGLRSCFEHARNTRNRFLPQLER